MITSPEVPVAPLDDRSYLYPHAWEPPPGAPADPWADLPPAGRDPDSRLDWGFGSVVAPPDEQTSSAERAVIGDALRIPAVWCEFGACIGRFTDPSALGQCDVRRLAIAAGWRQDALGRLACRACVQHDPDFAVSYPLVPAGELPQSPESPDWVGLLDELTHEPDSGLYIAGDPEPDAGLSAWDMVEPPRISFAPDPEPARLGWWRHREAGRHRLSA